MLTTAAVAGRLRAGVALLAVVWASVVGAQSLGEIAQRERDKRKDKARTAKTYTEQDLAARRPAETARKSAAPPFATPSPPSASPTAEYDPLKDKALEARWRERFAAARLRLADAEARAWTTRVETVFVNSIPVQQQVRVFEETEELRQAKQAQGVLEEELRRAGLPPGWGRE